MTPAKSVEYSDEFNNRDLENNNSLSINHAKNRDFVIKKL